MATIRIEMQLSPLAEGYREYAVPFGEGSISVSVDDQQHRLDVADEVAVEAEAGRRRVEVHFDASHPSFSTLVAELLMRGRLGHAEATVEVPADGELRLRYVANPVFYYGAKLEVV